MRRFIGIVLLLFLLIPSVATGQAALPQTPVRAVIDNYFGTNVVDPYRWLENTSDPEVIAWMKAQNDYTRAVLARIPGRDELLARIKSLDNAGNTVSALQVWGGHYFYYKTEPGSDNRKLFTRDTLSSPQRLLVDTEKMTTADGKHHSIDYFQPSLDGVYVAYGISLGGSEESVLHVLQSSTGQVLPDSIDRAEFASPSWLPDGKSFFYTRAQKLTPDSPPTAKYQKLKKVYRHSLGGDPDSEPLAFGFGVNPSVNVNENDFTVVGFSPGAAPFPARAGHPRRENESLIFMPCPSTPISVRKPFGRRSRTRPMKSRASMCTAAKSICSPTKMLPASRFCAPVSAHPIWRTPQSRCPQAKW